MRAIVQKTLGSSTLDMQEAVPGPRGSFSFARCQSAKSVEGCDKNEFDAVSLAFLLMSCTDVIHPGINESTGEKYLRVDKIELSLSLSLPKRTQVIRDRTGFLFYFRFPLPRLGWVRWHVACRRRDNLQTKQRARRLTHLKGGFPRSFYREPEFKFKARPGWENWDEKSVRVVAARARKGVRLNMEAMVRGMEC
jgi:hypothetical protein